jgi:RecG-like helicase
VKHIFQIPRYIITLHELLAHTPHDHVERKSLQNTRQQLENLSRQMHDEVYIIQNEYIQYQICYKMICKARTNVNMDFFLVRLVKLKI